MNLTNIEKAEIKLDIDSLIDLLSSPPANPPGGLAAYREMLKFKIKNLSNKLYGDESPRGDIKDVSRHYSSSVSFAEMVEMAGDIDRVSFGLIEDIKVSGINQIMSALIDSGNGAYNVLHGIDIEDVGHQVSFTTVGDQRLTMDKHEDVFIHVGSGNKETRPVIDLTIEIAGKVYPDVMFSIADRSENQHPVLIGADFLSQIDAIIDVNK